MFRLFGKKEPVIDRDIALRGTRAKDFLENPVFDEVLEDLENYFWKAFFDSLPDNEQARDILYQNINNLRGIKSQLETWVEEGNLAQHIINQEEQ